MLAHHFHGKVEARTMYDLMTMYGSCEPSLTQVGSGWLRLAPVGSMACRDCQTLSDIVRPQNEEVGIAPLSWRQDRTDMDGASLLDKHSPKES